jgi:phage/plasmid-associated DNA primase
MDKLAGQEWRFTEPAATRSDVAELRGASSIISMFVDERCSLAEDVRVGKAQLYEAWQSWCTSNGHVSGSSSQFGRDLRSLMSTALKADGIKVTVTLRDKVWGTDPVTGAPKLVNVTRRVNGYQGITLNAPE